MRQCLLLLAALLLSPVAGCGERLPASYVFSGPQPPSPVNAALCRSLCEKAACNPGVMGECLSGCALPRDCESQWSSYLKCEQGVSDLACTEKGVVSTPSCNDEYRAYRLCYFEAN